MPTLVVVDPQGGEQEIDLEEGEYVLGRDKGAGIQLESPKVSRRHARIFQRGAQFFIEDLGSANGVFVGGERIDAPTPLTGTAEVDIGDFRLLLVEPQLADARFTLSGETPPLDGVHIALADGEHEVGRVADCAVSIDDPSVSRRHAKLTVSPAGMTVEDLGSSNGTFVDGRRVARSAVRPGERLRFGNIELSVSGAGGAAFAWPSKNLLLIGGGLVALLVVGLAVALVARSGGKAQGGVFETYDAMLAAENEKAQTLLAAEAWAAAAQQFADVLDKDPLNKAARAGQTTAEQNLKHQEVLALAKRDLERDAPAEALHRLAGIPPEAHYGQAAALLVKQARTAVAVQAINAARAACGKGDFLECHRQAVVALGHDVAIVGAKELVSQAERELRAKKTPFTPWEGGP